MIVLKQSKMIQLTVYLTLHHIYEQKQIEVVKILLLATTSHWHVRYYSTYFSLFQEPC
jgi:hypothetical protein